MKKIIFLVLSLFLASFVFFFSYSTIDAACTAISFVGTTCTSPNVVCDVPNTPSEGDFCCDSQQSCNDKVRSLHEKPNTTGPSSSDLNSFSTTLRSVDFFSGTLWSKQFSASSGGTIGSLVQNVLTYAFTIAGILLLFYLIVSGFKMFTSGGDQKKVAEAKASLTNALVGFVIVFIAFWIVQLGGSILGLGGNSVFQGLFR